MFFNLNGKRALVTGAASGIGLAVARRFEVAGANVIYTDLPDVAPDGVTEDAYRQLDVTDQVALQRLAAEIEGSKLDILVSNAGIALEEGVLAQSDVEAVRKIVEVNLIGGMLVMKHLAPKVCDGGSIIHTASAAAALAMPEFGAYAASKSGVTGLVRVGAVELGARGVRVNAVCPGTIETPMTDASSNEGKFTKQVCALNRIGRTSDLVGLYHFLASDESAYLTGQSLYVDGGLSAGYPQHMIDAVTS